AAAADDRDQLAGAYRQVDAVVHHLAPEAGRHALQRDHRHRAQRPIPCSTTANSASITITPTIACTTVDVVLTPIVRVSRAPVMPIRQPITAISSANTGALTRPMIA